MQLEYLNSAVLQFSSIAILRLHKTTISSFQDFSSLQLCNSALSKHRKTLIFQSCSIAKLILRDMMIARNYNIVISTLQSHTMKKNPVADDLAARLSAAASQPPTILS